jgi:hypothetical protein
MSQQVKLHTVGGTDAAAATQPAKAEDKPAPKKEGKKPTKVLPTVRIAFTKQLDVLRAFAAASGLSNKLVTLQEVSEIIGLASTTISLANPFWVDVKFLNRTEGQGFTVANELTEYAHAFEWNRDTAAHKLAPLLSRQWFWEALEPRLRFSELSEDDAVTILAEKSTAGPDYKSQLKMILEYLDAGGLITKANGLVALVRNAPTGAQAAPAPAPEEKQAATPEGKKQTGGRSGVSTNFDQGAHGVSFDISVRVDMSEFGGWQPARIQAFFNGIAQVIAAKGAMEQDSSKE